MFLLMVLCTVVATTSASSLCSDDIEEACMGMDVTMTTPNCNAIYGNINYLQPDLQAFANLHINNSLEFLLTSFFHGKDFHKSLSDYTWHKAIDIIKYITSRGGKMNFERLSHSIFRDNYPIHESKLHSFSKTLDLNKELTKSAFHLHDKASKGSARSDPAIAHYIEKEFIEPHTDIIRALAGFVSDLTKLSVDHDVLPIAMSMFEDYIKQISL